MLTKPKTDPMEETNSEEPQIDSSGDNESISDGKEGRVSECSKEPPRKQLKRDKRDERRMEINRIRAKQIRKRKKEMEQDMQKHIIQLTLENNKLRTQLKVQETEITLLRAYQMNGSTYATTLDRQQPYLTQNHSQHLLGANNSSLNMLPLINNTSNLLQSNNSLSIPGITEMGFGRMPGGQPVSQGLSNITSSSMSAQTDIAPIADRHDLNILNLHSTGSSERELCTTMPNIHFDTEENDDQQVLTKLLRECSPHVKQSLMEKLQHQRKMG